MQIPGTTKLRRPEENIGAVSIEMTPDEPDARGHSGFRFVGGKLGTMLPNAVTVTRTWNALAMTP